jgi:hypothetical protein
MNRVLLGLLLVGCSNDYTEGPLSIRWTPPAGVKLESEATEGNVTTAHFSGGVDIVSVAAAPLPTEGDLDELKKKIVSAGHLKLPGEARSGKAGTIPAGPTVRWEMYSGDDRSLIYYVAGKDRYVLLTMTSPAAQFNKRSDKMELSMGSLHFK